MKAKLFLFTCCFACLLNAKAQYEAANWPMLYHNLVLKITPDIFERDSLPYGTYATFMANASISDRQGNLQVFSYGCDVRNKYGGIMDGGCCIFNDYEYPNLCEQEGDPHVQGAMILPRPGSETQYYLFIRDKDSLFQDGAVQPMRVTATLVDMSYNNGVGKVIQQPTSILEPVSALSDSRMTAVKHANGRDWWLVNHQYLTNTIYTSLITPDSIYSPLEQAIGGNGSEPDNAGWSVFSPNGSVFATVTGGMGSITLLDFDRCSGQFSNYRAITYDTSNDYYDNLAFSPNGRFLYAGSQTYVRQFDLMDTNISQSQVLLVNDTANYPQLDGMALALDNKIYIVNLEAEDSFMSVIDSPDLKAPACNFHLRNIYVRNSVLLGIVPNFPNYNLGALQGSGCDTLITGTAVISPTKENSIRVFPNPATDNINIITSLHPEETGVIDIFDISGVRVGQLKVTGGITTNAIDIVAFSNGVYMYYLHTNQQYAARGKIVIAH